MYQNKQFKKTEQDTTKNEWTNSKLLQKAIKQLYTVSQKNVPLCHGP